MDGWVSGSRNFGERREGEEGFTDAKTTDRDVNKPVQQKS